MTFYSDLAAESLAMLTDFGRDVTWQSFTAGTYDPATGGATPSSTSATRKGAVFDFGAGQTMMRGSLIQAGDKRLFLDATAPVSVQDQCTIAGDVYAVVSVGEVNPAGTPVLYDIHLSR